MNLKKEKFRIAKNEGITLVALVVTVVILIILATLSISVTFGEGGLIAKAKKAGQDTESAITNEQELMDRIGDETANILASVGSSEQNIPAGTEVKKPEGETPEDKWSDKVTAISDGSGNAIPLPDGFYYVGGDRTEGLVISDNVADKDKGTSYETASTLQGNQFVWIPADNEEALTRTNFDENGQPTTGLDTAKYKEPYEKGYLDGNGTEETADFNTMKTQVLKYKGFYIGRYEAGDGDSGSTTRTKATVPHTVVCKKGVAPYNYIPWGKSMSDVNTSFAPTYNNADNVETYGAVYLSKHMYDGKAQNESIVSTLCYGSQWDAMCRYIGDSFRSTPKKSEPEVTGSVKTDMSKNIYDLAGNCCEWTMEANNDYDSRYNRGGYYYLALAVSIRDFSLTDGCGNGIGFRTSLYVKE